MDRSSRVAVAISGGLEAVAPYVPKALFFVLVFWFVYWLNQYAVRKQLEPRRKELQALHRNLNESGEDEKPPIDLTIKRCAHWEPLLSFCRSEAGRGAFATLSHLQPSASARESRF
jgi:hypothetical protein